jgi:hypothetical protein
MIFPEGSHNKKRNIRPLIKGFTRIIFGALEKHPDLEITLLPVGITYQHPSQFPAKVTVNYGKPIATRTLFETNTLTKSVQFLKDKVNEQLKELTVHIPNNENYETVLQKLNDAQVDFTAIYKVNEMIKNNAFPPKKAPKKNYLKPVLFLIILNSILPFLIWKKVRKKIDEIEFIDTFRFGLNLVLCAIFYGIQAWAISLYFGNIIGFFYLSISALLLIIYVKLAPTNAKKYTDCI